MTRAAVPTAPRRLVRADANGLGHVAHEDLSIAEGVVTELGHNVVDERVYKLVTHDGAHAHLGQQVDARRLLAAIDLVQAALVAVPHDERERGARLSMRVEDALELLELLGIDDELDFLHGRFLPWSLPHSKRRTFRQGGAALIEQGGRNAMRRFSSLRVASAEQPYFRCATVWSTFGRSTLSRALSPKSRTATCLRGSASRRATSRDCRST